jgi:hypothetical protein
MTTSERICSICAAFDCREGLLLGEKGASGVLHQFCVYPREDRIKLTVCGVVDRGRLLSPTGPDF